MKMSVSLCTALGKHTLKGIVSLNKTSVASVVTAPACYLRPTSHKVDTAYNEWRTIYRLPLVRWASAFNGLKVYQFIITAIGTPVVYGLEQAGQVGSNACTIFAAVGVSGFLTLAVSSFAVRHLIGFIYINQSEDKLKLAYVDYWGKRRDAVVDVEDLLPVGGAPATGLNLYQSIRLRSDEKRKYKLLQNYGMVLEPDTFASIFGE